MLVEKLNEDIKTAMKEKNSEKLLALRTLYSDVKNIAIKDSRKELTDEDVLTAVQKAIKQRSDSATQFRNGGRIELAETEEAQINFYKVYLPEQLTNEQLEILVRQVILTVGATTKKDIGRVMKELTPRIKGKADMREVNSIISGILQ